MAPVPHYRDDLITLTEHTPADLDDHLAGEDEETARQFGWWPERSTRESVARAFAEWADSWRGDGPVHTFAVRDRATGALLGGCQLRKGPDGGAEVSYWTGAPHRGRGWARRALRLLCAHAGAAGIGPLEAHIARDNPASAAVARAAGFARRGVLPDEPGVDRYVLELDTHRKVSHSHMVT